MSKLSDTATSRWLAVLFISTGAVVMKGTALALDKPGCERQAISMLISPDDMWVALVHEDVCSDGAFVTTVTDTVQLARRDAIDAIKLATHADVPKHENDVFAVDVYGYSQLRPLTRWLSLKKLQVTVPNKSLIGLQKPSYEGIEIVVKFEPDDPAGREQWLKSFGLPTK